MFKIQMASHLRHLRDSTFFRSLLVDTGAKKSKIVIDYSSPNIAKQFHIGNLRSTLLGRYIHGSQCAKGNEVISVNYLGDWGVQFAMIAAYWPQVKPSDTYWDSLTDVGKIRSLTDCYVVANKRSSTDEDFREEVRKTYMDMEMSLKLGVTDTPSLKLWNDVRTLSKRHLAQFYDILGIKFDSWMHESDYVVPSHSYVNDLISKNIVTKAESGFWTTELDNGEYAILRKSDDTSLYLSREIAAIIERDRLFQADRYLFVVDRAQRKHFTALKILLSRMGKSDLADKIEHVTFGRVKGLSTRNGVTEAVGDIILNGTDLAKDFIHNSKTKKIPDDEVDEVARKLSLSTIVFNDMKRARNSEYEFSFTNAFALNHNNSLLLQTKYSRLCSIEEKNAKLLPLLETCQIIPEDTEEVVQLIIMLNNAITAVTNSTDNMEPCHLVMYLVQLANLAGTVAAQLKVKGQRKEIAVPRLLLLSSVKSVLYEGMQLLGIPPVKRM